MCKRSEQVNISQLFCSFFQTRHLTVGLSQPKPKLDLETLKMTRQFRFEKRGKNSDFSGKISHCATTDFLLSLQSAMGKSPGLIIWCDLFLYLLYLVNSTPDNYETKALTYHRARLAGEIFPFSTSPILIYEESARHTKDLCESIAVVCALVSRHLVDFLKTKCS